MEGHALWTLQCTCIVSDLYESYPTGISRKIRGRIPRRHRRLLRFDGRTFKPSDASLQGVTSSYTLCQTLEVYLRRLVLGILRLFGRGRNHSSLVVKGRNHPRMADTYQCSRGSCLSRDGHLLSSLHTSVCEDLRPSIRPSERSRR